MKKNDHILFVIFIKRSWGPPLLLWPITLNVNSVSRLVISDVFVHLPTHPVLCQQLTKARINTVMPPDPHVTCYSVPGRVPVHQMQLGDLCPLSTGMRVYGCLLDVKNMCRFACDVELLRAIRCLCVSARLCDWP